MKKIKYVFVFLGMLLVGFPNQINAQVGLFTLTGDLSFLNGASYEAEIIDLTGAGSGHDQIVVTGNLILDGTLDIVLDGYSPVITDSFEILIFGEALSGTFSNIKWPTEMINQGWVIDYGVVNPGKVTIYGTAISGNSNVINSDFSFFPNPTRGSISFEKEVSNLVVYDVNGKKILESKDSSKTFDLSDLPNGNYFIRINKKLLAQKLMINK